MTKQDYIKFKRGEIDLPKESVDRLQDFILGEEQEMNYKFIRSLAARHESLRHKGEYLEMAEIDSLLNYVNRCDIVRSLAKGDYKEAYKKIAVNECISNAKSEICSKSWDNIVNARTYTPGLSKLDEFPATRILELARNGDKEANDMWWSLCRADNSLNILYHVIPKISCLSSEPTGRLLYMPCYRYYDNEPSQCPIFLLYDSATRTMIRALASKDDFDSNLSTWSVALNDMYLNKHGRIYDSFDVYCGFNNYLRCNDLIGENVVFLVDCLGNHYPVFDTKNRLKLPHHMYLPTKEASDVVVDSIGRATIEFPCFPDPKDNKLKTVSVATRLIETAFLFGAKALNYAGPERIGRQTT